MKPIVLKYAVIKEGSHWEVLSYNNPIGSYNLGERFWSKTRKEAMQKVRDYNEPDICIFI